MCMLSALTKLWLGMCCVPSGPFPTAGSPCILMAILIVIVEPYAFESRVTVEPPDIIDQFAGVYLSMLFLSYKWYSEYQYNL